MKKFIYLLSILGIAFAASSFVSSEKEMTPSVVSNEAAAPVYWQGRASNTGNGYIYIRVYEYPNACNSFYAVVDKSKSDTFRKGDLIDGEELVVRQSGNNYYVSTAGIQWYFNM